MTHPFFKICHNQISFQPWKKESTRRLPGVNPIGKEHWLVQDEVFEQQMAYRDHLIQTKREMVFRCNPEGFTIANELLETILEHLSRNQNYTIEIDKVHRPDGKVIFLDSDHPLVVAGRLVQEDLCILHRGHDQHELVGGFLCFPASWLLSEKLGMTLDQIHQPVSPYNAHIQKVVQRMFDNLKPETVIYRGNYLAYETPDLFQPQSFNEKRDQSGSNKEWIRVERQTLQKLPKTKGIVFGIHTAVCHKDKVEDLDEFLYYLQLKNSNLDQPH